MPLTYCESSMFPHVSILSLNILMVVPWKVEWCDPDEDGLFITPGKF